MRISNIEKNAASPLKPVQEVTVTSSAKPVEDDVDLFGSDSDEENEAAAKVREERLAAYNAKKSKSKLCFDEK